MQFTRRQKFSLIFSVYVSLFIVLVGTIFFLILHTILIYQVKKDTALEASNALKNHIAIQGDAAVVVKDKTGGLLSDQIVESNVSVLLLSKDLKVIQGYGLLELYNESDRESVDIIAKMAEDAQASLKQFNQQISWRGQNMTVYVTPVKNSGKSYGTIVTAKSLAQIESLENVILIVLFGLAASSILASLFLSHLLVGKIFRPIRELTEIISATNLDKLDKSLEISGSHSDELVVLASKFNGMMVRLKSMSEIQKEFIANASHELKTPLSRAISSFDLSISSNEISNQTLKDIRDDLFEINGLLDKLMFLSRLKPGLVLQSDKLSLNKLITEYAGLYKKEAENKNVSIITGLDGDCRIFIPKEYAKVLLSNLLSNAVKYSRKDSVVKIQTQKAGNKAVLIITDQGFGINKFDLKKIGERFYRGESGKKAIGHGIGLSIVKRITELYQINFLIKSEPSKGTVIKLEFPIY